jgi:hypothetical protein
MVSRERTVNEAQELGRGIPTFFALLWLEVFARAKDKRVNQAQIKFDDPRILSRYPRGLAYLIFQ